jgi:hypothetical protein
MLRRWIIFSLLTLVPYLPAAPAQARGTRAIQVSTVSHGLKLTLTVPAGEYPRGGLVRAMLSVQNISPGDIGLLGSDVQVLSTKGEVLYPPSVPPTIEPKGVTPWPPLRLRSGRAVVERPFIVLRGPYVHAVVWLGKLGKRYVPPGLGARRSPPLSYTSAWFRVSHLPSPC